MKRYNNKLNNLVNRKLMNPIKNIKKNKLMNKKNLQNREKFKISPQLSSFVIFRYL